MRVLYLVTRADMGGAQIHILDLLRGFRRAVDPVVAVGEEGFFLDAVRKLGIPAFVLPNLVHPITPLKDSRAILDTARLIRKVKAAIVHAHTSKAGIVGRLAARVAGVPAVFTAHTWCFAEGTSLKWRLVGIPAERFAGFWSSAIINVSEANRRLAVSHRISDHKRMVTIWNGIPDTPHRSRPDAPGHPHIVMVARFVEQKDQSLLLQAFAKLDRPAKLSLVGDGPKLEAVQAEAGELHLRDRVEFLGRRSDVAKILAGANIFALATKWEGLPLSILEAMRAGLPVIASDVGGVREAVTDGETGFVVESGDAGGLEQRLATLVQDSSLRKRFGAAGRSRYESNFTLEQMLSKTLTVYQMAALGVEAAHALLPIPVSIPDRSPLHTGS
jgi:glycosyltransferase involved in cell wall biosynthesis